MTGKGRTSSDRGIIHELKLLSHLIDAATSEDSAGRMADDLKLVKKRMLDPAAGTRPGFDKVVAVLTRGLQCNAPETRGQAATLLGLAAANGPRICGWIPTAILGAVPELVGALSDKDDRVRERAVDALGDFVDEAAGEVVRAIIDNSISDPSVEVIKKAVQVLAKCDKATLSEGIPKLLVLLQHPLVEVRQRACLLFGHLGARAHSALDDLLAVVLQDEDRATRVEAVKALMQIDREGTRVAAAIDIELSREEIRGLLRRLGRGAQEYRRLLDTIWAQSSSASQREQGEPTELGKLPASAAGRQLMRTQEIYRHIFGPGASANKARTISDWIRSGRLDAIRKRRGFYDVSLASLNALTEAHRADRC